MRNRLLLGLIGEFGEPELCDDPARDVAPDDRLLAGMYLAKIGDTSKLARFVAEAGPLDVSPLSRLCLFIGLTGNPSHGLDLFDVLKTHYPLCDGVWADLAVLQLANGYNLQAARSLAVHAALTGQAAPIAELPLGSIPSGSSGTAMRFMKGDAVNFSDE